MNKMHIKLVVSCAPDYWLCLISLGSHQVALVELKILITVLNILSAAPLA